MANREREVFTKNYSTFCAILKNEDGLLSKLVDKSIISVDDIDEIRNKPLGQRGQTLLQHISGPLNAGHTHGFYGLIEIMRNDGKPDTQEFGRQIKRDCEQNDNGMLHYYCIDSLFYVAEVCIIMNYACKYVCKYFDL